MMEVNKQALCSGSQHKTFFTLNIPVPKICLCSLVQEGRTDMVHQKQWWEEKVEIVPETIQGEKNPRLCEQCLVLEE